MSIALAAFDQIIIMFIIIIAGVICYKVKLIDKETNKKLANLVLMLVNPIVIFVSYQREFEVTLLKGLLISLVLAVATHLFGILATTIFLPKKNHADNIGIERFAVIYSNCGFMGIPLVNGIFGSEGVFYITAYMTIFNLFAWTHGMIAISGKTDKKSMMQAILSPMVIATVVGFIMFVCRLSLPSILTSALSFIGDMNTPMAMLVAGATIAQADLKKLLKKARAYYITALKLLLMPIAMLFIFQFLDLSRTVLITAVLAAACPAAATVNLFALRFDKDYLYASELFALTTIFSLITIPVVMIIANLML
jgi:malate permease and related proteins